MIDFNNTFELSTIVNTPTEKTYNTLYQKS